MGNGLWIMGYGLWAADGRWKGKEVMESQGIQKYGVTIRTPIVLYACYIRATTGYL